MKKKDIIKIINAKSIIKKNYNLLKTIKVLDEYLPEEKWVPSTKKYKEQFDILKKEISDTLKETKESEDVINNIKCNHEVRLEHLGVFHSQYECVVCGRTFSSNSSNDWFQSPYINNHMVSFVNRDQTDWEGIDYTEKYGKSKEEVIDMILRILVKYNDDDEVDLVEEFSKMNIYGMTINKELRKEENYILIIGGTNLKYLDPNEKIYVRKDYESSTIDFLNYFSQLLNTKIAIIENSNTLMKNEFIEYRKNKYLNFYSYNTLIELNKNINKLKSVPFKVIIDLTELYDYQFDDKRLSNKPYNLNLKELFPNSQIIKFTKLSSKSLQELKEFLLSQNNTIYANIGKDYYYLDENEIIKTNLEETCQNIKSLLRKKANYE